MTGSSIRSPCDIGIVTRPELWLLLKMEGEPVTKASWVWSGMVRPDWGQVILYGAKESGSDSMRAKMSWIDLSLEWIVPVPPPKVLSPCEAGPGSVGTSTGDPEGPCMARVPEACL